MKNRLNQIVEFFAGLIFLGLMATLIGYMIKSMFL
jgi:hypothetical protein